jgi:hypothetical protein
VRLKWGHLCTVADYSHRHWSIGGLFDFVSMPKSLARTMPRCFVAFAIESGEIESRLRVDLELRGPANQLVASRGDVPVESYTVGPGRPFMVSGLVTPEDWKLSASGPYRIVASVNGSPVDGEIAFLAGSSRRAAAAAHLGQVHLRGATLDWAHLCDRVEEDAPGSLVLRDITTHLSTKVDGPVRLNGELFSKFSLGSEEGPDHRIRVDLSSRHGAFVQPLHEWSIRAQTDGPGQGYKAFCRLHVDDVSLPGPGDYAFRFWIDEQHAGSLDHPVIRIPG